MACSMDSCCIHKVAKQNRAIHLSNFNIEIFLLPVVISLHGLVQLLDSSNVSHYHE
jgi:hypothetical protein